MSRALGHRTAVLGASAPGHGLHGRLGFEDICAIDVYEWSP